MDSSIRDGKTDRISLKNRIKLFSPFKKKLLNSWIISLSLFIIALWFSTYHLGKPSIWFDEAFSVELARQPFGTLWSIIFGPEPNMELYYLFLHFWLKFITLFGGQATEFLVRLPSAIFASLGAVAVFQIGKRYISLIAGIVGALLYLMNDLMLVYAQQTRSYALQVLLICISWFALLAILTGKTKQKRWWFVYIIATSSSVYTHLFSLLVIVVQFFVILIFTLFPQNKDWQIRMRWKELVISFFSLGLLIVPMLLMSKQGGKTGWLPIPHLIDIYTLFWTMSGTSWLYLYIAITLILVAIIVYWILPIKRFPFLKYLFSQDQVSQGKHSIVLFSLLCWLCIPILLSYIVSQGSVHLFSSRYLVVVVPPFCLLVGLGVAVVRIRLVQILIALGLIGWAFHMTPFYYEHAEIENWRSASYWLMQRYHNGDGLVCYDNTQGCQITIDYYLHTYSTKGAHFTSDSPGFFSWKHLTTDAKQALDPHALNTYAAKHPRLFFITARLSSQDERERVQDARQWLDQHYRYIDQIEVSGITIRLYDIDP